MSNCWVRPKLPSRAKIACDADIACRCPVHERRAYTQVEAGAMLMVGAVFCAIGAGGLAVVAAPAEGLLCITTIVVGFLTAFYGIFQIGDYND